MKRFLRDSGHLVRPALVFLVGAAGFLLIRSAVVPQGFGKYGHYRPAALEAIRQQPVVFAGQAECVLCHDAEAKTRAAGKHARVACEACHGPQARHAADPMALKPALPDVAALCVRCHQKDSAKPNSFPQVAPAEHSGGMVCNTCHQPHNPHL
ncbi:MAG: cytochrome C [Terriglobia bacterium]|nr:MAG: cytochrome C [Terriglobia bacterium]